MTNETNWIRESYKNGGAFEALENISLPIHAALDYFANHAEELDEEEMHLNKGLERYLQDAENIASYVDELIKDIYRAQFARTKKCVRKWFPALSETEVETRAREIIF